MGREGETWKENQPNLKLFIYLPYPKKKETSD